MAKVAWNSLFSVAKPKFKNQIRIGAMRIAVYDFMKNCEENKIDFHYSDIVVEICTHIIRKSLGYCTVYFKFCLYFINRNRFEKLTYLQVLLFKF